MAYVEKFYRFKYNTCYCSTDAEQREAARQFDSNTTPVTVQPKAPDPTATPEPNSNTTPVTVQLAITVSKAVATKFKYNTCYCSTIIRPVLLGSST